MTAERNTHYESRARFHRLWIIRAEELSKAAHQVWFGGAVELLDQHGEKHTMIELYRPAQLLMGLSLEARAKGILIQRDPRLVSDGKLDGKLKTHSIERLFSLLGLPIEAGEEELNFVRRLSDAIEWVAKYPVPLSSKELAESRNKSERTMTRNDNDMKRFVALEDRLRREADDA